MELIFFIIIITLACFLQGIVGFGFALLAAPLALIFLEKETVVSIMLIIGVIINSFLIKKIQNPVDYKRISFLFLASLVGMPLGIRILSSISMDSMKILVGTLVIVFASIIFFEKIRLPKTGFLTFLVGFISGILNTSTSTSGPPAVLLLTGENLPKEEFRKTLAYLFFLMSVTSLCLFIANKIITTKGTIFGLISIPFVLLAAFLGDRIAKKVSQKLFRILVLATVFLSGFYCIFSGSR